MMNVHLLTHLAVAASMGSSHGPSQALPYAHPADLPRADEKVPKIGSLWSQASLDLKMGPDYTGLIYPRVATFHMGHDD